MIRVLLTELYVVWPCKERDKVRDSKEFGGLGLGESFSHKGAGLALRSILPCVG